MMEKYLPPGQGHHAKDSAAFISDKLWFHPFESPFLCPFFVWHSALSCRTCDPCPVNVSQDKLQISAFKWSPMCKISSTMRENVAALWRANLNLDRYEESLILERLCEGRIRTAEHVVKWLLCVLDQAISFGLLLISWGNMYLHLFFLYLMQIAFSNK